MARVSIKRIEEREDGYVLVFNSIKIGKFQYYASKVSASKKEYEKLEIDLAGKNEKGEDITVSLLLLNNNMIKTAKRRRTLSTELFFNLTKIAQISTKAVSKYRNKDKEIKTECLIPECKEKASIPKEDPLFCTSHKAEYYEKA